MVNKEVIKDKKAIYGSNFECIATRVTEYLRDKELLSIMKDIEPEDIAFIMGLMKGCRIDAIDEKITAKEPNNNRAKLLLAKEDSVLDQNNYFWIARNYKEYKEL